MTSTRSGDRQFLLLVIRRPATLKFLSLAELEAGVARIMRATLARAGNVVA